jgi:hypothetical protein
MAEHRGNPIDNLADTERPQDPHTIRGQIEPCTDRRPHWAPFNEFWSVALTAQCGYQGEARDATPNDQDLINVSHGFLLSLIFLAYRVRGV